jgi:hypothetical protein
MAKQRTADAYRSIAGSFEGGSDDAPDDISLSLDLAGGVLTFRAHKSERR